MRDYSLIRVQINNQRATIDSFTAIRNILFEITFLNRT